MGWVCGGLWCRYVDRLDRQCRLAHSPLYIPAGSQPKLAATYTATSKYDNGPSNSRGGLSYVHGSRGGFSYTVMGSQAIMCDGLLLLSFMIVHKENNVP